MRLALAVVSLVLALQLSGCGSREPCTPTQAVRVQLGATNYMLPVHLQPALMNLERDGIERLPSHSHRDRDGSWAYCQAPDEPPAQVGLFLFSGLEFDAYLAGRPELAGVTLVTVEVERPRRKVDTGVEWPTEEIAGFTVVRTKGPTYVSRSAGEKRAVEGMCSPDLGSSGRCRIHFKASNGASVMFDLYGQPLSAWNERIAGVEALVLSFQERRPGA